MAIHPSQWVSRVHWITLITLNTPTQLDFLRPSPGITNSTWWVQEDFLKSLLLRPSISERNLMLYQRNYMLISEKPLSQWQTNLAKREVWWEHRWLCHGNTGQYLGLKPRGPVEIYSSPRNGRRVFKSVSP